MGSREADAGATVNTKADIRFDVLAADWLPDWVKENLMEQEKNRMNNEGELVVNSSRHRTQKCGAAGPMVEAYADVAPRQNYDDALEKMQVMIDTAAKPPTGPSEETIKKVKTLCAPCVFRRSRPDARAQRKEGEPEAPG